jgi:hemophore-related protein
MARLSLAKLAATVGGIGLALGAAAGVASADPMDAAINTTCNYGQVMAALNAQDPVAAQKFQRSAMAQGWLNNFLAAAPPERTRMAAQIQGMPGAAKYMDLFQSVAVSCNNY